MPKELVVVGASLAGLRAVETARKLGFEGNVTLVGAESHLPYDRPPLSKAFLDPKERPDLEPFRTQEHLEDDLGVELMLGHPATGLDVAAHTVQVGERTVRYDKLVIATGCTPRALPGTDDMRGVYALRTLDDAQAVRTALDAGARTVVIGAGFIGSEVASAARKHGLEVTIVETAELPLTRSVGGQVGQVCVDLHRDNGVDLRLGTGVAQVESSDGAVSAVVLSDGTRLEAELVVVGIGVAPATAWIGDQLELREGDRSIVCDEFLRTSDPDVFAAGDVACWPHPLFDGELMRLEHWTSAAEHGTAAVTAALAPEKAVPSTGVPYFWSDWHEHRLQFVGIPHADEVRVIAGEETGERFLALYRRGDRLVGALTLDRPTQIMKFRRLISQRALWDEGVELARTFTESAP